MSHVCKLTSLCLFGAIARGNLKMKINGAIIFFGKWKCSQIQFNFCAVHTTIVLHTVLYWEQMEPSGRTILIFQPKGRLFKSEFGVGGLQTTMIFVYIWLITTCFEPLSISSFSSVIKRKITSPVTKSGEVYQNET